MIIISYRLTSVVQLAVSFSVVSLAMWQPNSFTGASEVTGMFMAKNTNPVTNPSKRARIFFFFSYWLYFTYIWQFVIQHSTLCLFCPHTPTPQHPPPTPEKNGRNSADDLYRRILNNEKFSVVMKFSLKFFLNGPINNNLALF